MRTLTDLGIARDDQERLLRGLHEGKYNLLLGAGASYGCLGGDGVELKDGTTLSQEIARDFSLNLSPDEAKKLPVAYEEAQSRDAVGLRRWLRARFTNCKPTWQALIFEIHWKRIWTFNIDDVLSSAFSVGKEKTVTSGLALYDWKERVAPLEGTLNKQQIIYLHGRAWDLGESLDGLIFSVPEYTHATRSFQQWHASFQTHYLEDPFIVCGASLVEEVDISEAIRAKNFSRAEGFPSFIAAHDLDDGQKERVKRFNLVPIVCPLQEFFEIVTQELMEYRKTADAIPSRFKPGTYERFLSQFRRFDTKDTSTIAIEGTDFYGGDEPTWMDILNTLDASFTVTERAASVLDSDAKHYAALIHGGSVSGKSVALLRVAREALQKGFKPFWFRHEEALNAEIVADYLSGDDRAILFIDDAANYLEPIGKALQFAKKSGTAARIFLSLRSVRLRGFRIDVADEFRKEFRIGTLYPRDIANLVARRRQASRLGQHIGKSDENITKDLKTVCKSELLECISFVEFSEPLRQRIRRIILTAFENSSERDLIALISCVHRFGFSVPLRVAVTSTGLQFGILKGILDQHFKAEGILVRDYTGIRLRHRILSEYVWLDSLTEDERYQAMSSVVTYLSPLVNPAAIKAKAIEHLILREVLDQEHVSQSIGHNALKFYEEHEVNLGWSSRYWDQRALLESRIEGHFSKAYSYSQKAVSLERHPFAFTSLGAICMTHAVKLVSENRIEAMRFFHEGEEALGVAWRLADSSGKAHEHPFVKFFASSAQMFRKLRTSDTEFEAVLQLFRIWIQRAEHSPAFATSYGQRRLREMQVLEARESARARRDLAQ